MRNIKHLFVLTFCMVALGLPSEGAVLAKKTLKRPMDPVLMDGKVTKDLLGVPFDNLRLYAYHNGKLEPIRYQIDEMTKENGDWIFPVGVQPNGHLTNGKFDGWDVLLFMAEDAGDKVDKDEWKDGYTKGAEIEVIDPLTGEKGWVYLLYFANDPPARSQLPGYVRYTGHNHTMQTDYWGAEGIVTEDGRMSPAYKRFWINKMAGGNEENFVDRLKARVNMKLFFGSLNVRLHEETLKSGALAGMGGPVRINVRVEHYYDIPGGYKVLRVITDGSFYRESSIVPFVFNIPFKPSTVITSMTIRFGTDFSPNLKGKAISRNSENPEGFAVDGKMDDGEENFNPAPDKWRIISGNFGSFLARTIVSEEYKKYGSIKMGLLDDETQPAPPETYPGSIGFMYGDWGVENLPKGSYHIFVEWCFPPKYKPGDEVQYCNTMDHPLKIHSGTQEGMNQCLKVANIDPMYTKLLTKEKFSERKYFIYDRKLGKYEERSIEDTRSQFSGTQPGAGENQ